MIPLSTPDLRGRELDYLRDCIQDNWVSSVGPFVTGIEQRIAALCGVPYAIATVNGTTALQLALLGAGIQPGDRVALPDWTFAATANAVIHAGARPVFCDIDEVNLTLSPHRVEEAFAASRPIRAVVALHVLGRAPDLDKLGALCRRHGAALIEDAAGAFGARDKRGRMAGAIGDAGIFSFNGNKIATAGGGGMIVTRNEELARRARHLSQQARTGEDYSHDDVGFNYRMTNLNAAVGLAQLERLDEMKARRLEIERRYDAALFPARRVTPLPKAAWDTPYSWLYSVRCRDMAAAGALVESLRRQSVEARRFWRALSPQPPYSGFERIGGDIAEALSGTVVSLPCSSHLTNADQDMVIAAVKSWDGGAA